MMQHITSKDGTPIAYEKVGKGPALILVGGALNDHKAVASGMPLAKRLAANFTVYTYDRRGRGESGDTQPYTIEREVEDIAALIQNAGGSAYAYGMSSGGALALEAARRGLAIKKLALYEPPFVGQGNEYLARVQQLTAAKRSSDAVKLFLQTIGMPGFLIGGLRLTPMWPQLKKLAPSLVYDAMIMGDGTTPPAAQLAQITVPTLVVTGPTQRMREAAHTLVSGLPNARQQVLEGQTHNVKPGAFAPALTTFFRES